MVGDSASSGPALCYAYNRGGISNQKIALLGLFLKAATEGPPRIVLPDLVIFDQITFVHHRVPIATVFDMTRLAEFADTVGVTIVEGGARGDEGGWEYYHHGESRIAGAAASGRLDSESFVVRFFRALVPRVRMSDDVLRLRDVVFDRLGVTHVVQMRIEPDWDFHVSHRLDPEVGHNEDNRHSAETILRKLRASVPDGRLKACVLCDEAALTVDKEQIRNLARDAYDVEITWKSDLSQRFEARNSNFLDLSLTDFEIALAARSFVGTSRSTFSGMAALEQFAQSGSPGRHSVYNMLGPMLVERRDTGAFRPARLATARNLRDPSCGYELGRILEAAGELQAAHDAYAARGKFGGPDREEVYLALTRAARLKMVLGATPDDVIGAFEQAAATLPSRAEALHGAALYARCQGRYEEACAFAARGLDVARPPAGRDIESSVYDWALLDEYAVATSWTGRPAETLRACIRLLTEAKLPGEHRDRIVANAKFAVDRLAGL